MKSNMLLVRLVVCWSLSIDIPVSLTTKPICLTWNTTVNYLLVECTVYKATSWYEIFIIDPYGRHRGMQCFLSNFRGCDTSLNNDGIDWDNSNNITTVMIRAPKKDKKDNEGLWKCQHGQEEKTTLICYTEGSTSTIDVKLTAKISKIKEEHVFKLECFSCWKPHIEGVAFYVNGVLEDSIRYQNGLCYHKKNLCNPDKCACSSEGKYFTWIFKSDLSYIQFTCAMRFKDKTKSTFTTHQSSLIYNGTGFMEIQNKNKSDNHLDQNTDDINMDKDRENNSEYIGYSVLGTVGLIISITLIACFWKMNRRGKQAFGQDEKSQREIIPLQDKESNDNLSQCNKITQKETAVMYFRKIVNVLMTEKSLDDLKIYTNACDHLTQFGLEVLKCWGVEVEKDRVSFHMNKLQSLGSKHHIVLHDLTACLLRDRSFQFLRLYDVVQFKLTNLKLNKNMYDELNKIFKLIIDMKGEKWWYHYRRNGLHCKGSSEGAFNLVNQVFLSKRRSAIFKQFDTKESRLSTFQDYPIENNSYREKLALAGFFYFHVSDYVQCFDCGGCLRAWKSMCDPMKRHKETFKTCSFACDTYCKESSFMDAEPVMYDSMHSEEYRLNSFKTFPDTLSRDDVEQLAQSGFYYCGISEDIVCSSCNIEFASVKSSECILRLHKKYSRKCPNIAKFKTHAMRSGNFNQESISNFVPYLELEYRKHAKSVDSLISSSGRYND